MQRDPFEFAGDERGVLCIHGFTGTPYEMRYLGTALAGRGCTVRGLALPGHATTIDDLLDRRWPEWAEAVTAAYDDLARRCSTVAVVGQSLGGLLALHLATRRAPAAVASLAAPLWLDGLGGLVARALTRGPLAHRVALLPKLGGSDVRAPAAKRANPSYAKVPVRALGELLAYMDVVDAALPAVRAPLLVLHATHDHTAPVACAHRIALRVATPPAALRLRILPASFHLISIDVERAIVAAEVGAFFERHLRPTASA